MWIRVLKSAAKLENCSFGTNLFLHNSAHIYYCCLHNGMFFISESALTDVIGPILKAGNCCTLQLEY